MMNTTCVKTWKKQVISALEVYFGHLMQIDTHNILERQDWAKNVEMTVMMGIIGFSLERQVIWA